jgi:hypothetical protein
MSLSLLTSSHALQPVPERVATAGVSAFARIEASGTARPPLAAPLARQFGVVWPSLILDGHSARGVPRTLGAGKPRPSDFSELAILRQRDRR